MGEAGTSSVGGSGQGGATQVGGSGPYGGASQVGGSAPVGGSSGDLNCLVNVAHCFEAAANCFEFSPGSDCDQIVDVCAAMQADCDAASP